MKSKFNRSTKLFSEKPQYKSIGYIRQSSNTKISISAQVEELKNAGCFAVLQEAVGTNRKENPQLKRASEILKEGDEIVCTKLDHGFRNQRQCINTLQDLQKKGIHIRTTDGIINTRALGKFAPIVIGLLSGLYEVERRRIIEKTQESINYRKETGGNLGGRPKTNNEKESLVRRLRHEGCSYRSIRTQTGLALSTIRRIIVDQEKIES